MFLQSSGLGRIRIILTLIIFGATMVASANVLAEDEKTELAKKTQNPVSDLISVPIMNNLGFNAGPEDDLQNTLNIMAVVPQKINANWNWIHRAVIPIVSQPAPIDEWGLSDIQYQGYVSPANVDSVVWGVGPVLQMPTATDDSLGSEKWSAGAGLVALQMKGPWVYGALLNNIWSFAGADDREDVNLMFIQPFVNYNLGNGLAIGSVPQITANWEAESGNVWTVPLGAQVSKIMPIGKQPINWIAGGYYNVEKPDNGADWVLRLQVQFLFPK
jgi:hypothetical protein